MSKYTTQVRWIIENATSGSSELPISKKIELACPIIFNFTFPIWDENYRPILEKKILMHYFNKEIGLETVGLWKLYLEERLNLIMPYYNNLYATTVKDYDYLSDTKIEETYTANKIQNENANFSGNTDLTGNTTEDFTGKVQDTGKDTFTGTGTNTTDNTQTQTTKNLRSDLPQANYANLDYGTQLDEGEQTNTSHEDNTIKNDSTNDRSNITDTTNNDTVNVKQQTNQTSSNDVKTTANDTYTRNRVGLNGGRSFTELLIQYRESLLNIDNLIINDLSDLFMTIY